MKKYFTILFIAILWLTSCEAIFETDLSDATISVVSPVNNANVDPGEVTFLWRKLEHAKNYHFTLVSPSFSAAKKVIADTVICDTLSKYSYTTKLESGDYQWSIRAFNSGHSTSEQIYTLKVE